ncbi:MAG: hypothetical protein AB1798_15325 [Spirochaetota bacterium]
MQLRIIFIGHKEKDFLVEEKKYLESFVYLETTADGKAWTLP